MLAPQADPGGGAPGAPPPNGRGPILMYTYIKAADLQNILEYHSLYNYFKISLQIHIIVVRNQNNC